jgi:hypothetical protein
VTNREIVAWGFRIGGWVLGVPSLVALVTVIAGLFVPRPAPDKSPDLDVQTYGIAGLLTNGAKGVGKALDGLGGFLSWVEWSLAIGLSASLGLAVVLYFTGRGIARHSTGAGVFGIGLSAIFLLLWLTILMSLPRGGAMAVPAVGMALSLYAIWVLVWR